MLIHFGYEIIFNLPQSIPLLLKLYTHPSVADKLKQPEQLQLWPNTDFNEFYDDFGNRCVRVLAPQGQLRIWNDAVIEDSGRPDVVDQTAQQISAFDLPSSTLQYLLNSRYCEVDLLSDAAWNLFGDLPPGWSRVQAICDWVHTHVRYGYGESHPSKTASEVFATRTGVCRDFAHLAIAFCRCLNIPARYASGYLGDIGVPAQPRPIDFHAWFEAFIGGQWHTFDARHNQPRIGRILMARGRDATDVALSTSFGTAKLEKFKVWTEALSPALTH
ncbi:MAG TPA: transglutaminase family protein [Stenomitos sp.]